MSRLELVYVPPFPVDRDSPFNFHVFGLRDEGTAPTLRPVYARRHEGGLMLVAGHRRMAAALARREERIAALVCPDDADREALIGLALDADSDLSGIERLVAVRKTMIFATGGDEGPVPDALLALYGPFLGRTVSSSFVLRLLAHLDENTEGLRELHACGFTVAHLIAMLELQPRERRTLSSLHARTPMSVGEVRNMARLILFARGRKTVDLVAWAAAELESDARSGAAVTTSLFRAIYPDLSKRSSTIEDILKKAKLPPHMRITPPENLEGDSYSCYFKFSRAAELRRHVEYLKKGLEAGTFDRLLDTLNDEASGKE